MISEIRDEIGEKIQVQIGILKTYGGIDDRQRQKIIVVSLFTFVLTVYRKCITIVWIKFFGFECRGRLIEIEIFFGRLRC